MAIGESRYDAKQAAHTQDPSTWSFSTERIHSYRSRDGYQQHALAFLNWCRTEHGLRDLSKIDVRANELATRYLSERLEKGQSPYTLQAVRAALRMFFSNRLLAEELPLPRRERAKITRSRGQAARDYGFQSAHWEPLLAFLRATGPRRAEVTALRVCDIQLNEDGRAEVKIHAGKGGRPRTVVARPGRDETVLSLVRGRSPDEHVFERIPSHLDIHSYRREFAQGLYQELSGRPLPPATGRLRPGDYDRAAVEIVSKQLGHNRVDVVLRHYLR